MEAVGLPVREDVPPRSRCRSSTTPAWTATPCAFDDVATPPRTRRCTCPWSGRSAPARRRILALSPGTAVKIMTGAPVPAGCDAVVPYEWTDRGVAKVVISQAPEPGQHIRLAGEDVEKGDVLVEEGAVARPAPDRPARGASAAAGCRPGRDRASW